MKLKHSILIFGEGIAVKRWIDLLKEKHLQISLLTEDQTTRKFCWPKKYIVKAYRTRELLKNSDAKTIHIYFAYGFFQALITLWKNKPLISTVMGGDIFYREQMEPNWCLEALLKKTLKYSDFIIVRSAYMQKRLGELGIQEEKILYLNWGINSKIFLPKSQLKKESTPIIFSPRVMHPLYNIDLIIKAFKNINFNAKLIVIDSQDRNCEYSKKCHQLAQQLKLENKIAFIPFVKPNKLSELYNTADITLSIPKSDGLPKTPLESMACGTPVILGKLPNYADTFIHKENCLLSEIDPDSLCNAINQLYEDRDLYETVKKNGIEYVKNHVHTEQTLEKQKQLYEKAANLNSFKKTSFLSKLQILLLYTLAPIENQIRKLIYKITRS